MNSSWRAELQTDFQSVLLLLVCTGAVALLLRRAPMAVSESPATAAGTGAGPVTPTEGWRALVRAVFPVLLAVFLFRACVVEPYRIPTGSMIPTLAVGDYVFVSKFAYGLRLPALHWQIVSIGEPERGDVVVFVPPHEKRYFIKRVVGLPGDRIRLVAGELYINGERIDTRVDLAGNAPDGVQGFIETLGGAPHRIQRFVGMRSREGEWRVPAGSYFMLGDNRDMSEDSRYWGYVAGERIVGRAIAIWVHKQPGWSWPTLARNGVIH